MQQHERTTNNNLTALYKFLDTYGDPPGVVWSTKVIAAAQKLHEQTNIFNGRLDLKMQIDQKTYKDKAYLHEQIAAVESSLGDFKPGASYQALDLRGKMRNLVIPEVADDHRLRLCFDGIVELSKLFDKNDELVSNDLQSTLYTLKPIPITLHNKTRSCYHPNPPYKFWKHSWETGAWHHQDHIWGRREDPKDTNKYILDWSHISTKEAETLVENERWAEIWKTLSERLRGLVRKHADRLREVDKVVCFALGALTCETSRSFVQHLAARTVADTLEEIHVANGTPKTIRVVAQDPAYCSTCVAVLKNELEIDAVTDLSGFSALDRNAFVLTFCPTGPIPGIIADLTLTAGGTAAMLCDKLYEDYMRPEHEGGKWIDAVETKNLIEWKEGCLDEEFGDAKDFLGKSWAEFEAEFPRRPAEMPVETEKERRYREVVVGEFRRAARCGFRDAWLYVRRVC
jgi:hypothetical protein